ncbi:tail fiber assembly protein [Citrobacter freundii]|uniref:tail fiber assembly protein n=1 Tax=Citrobacter freundii TaxID=546 RepID=UPI00397DF26C
MNEFYYSQTKNAFYHESKRERYNLAGTWPDDAVAIDELIYTRFAATDVPEGKMRVAGADGMPAWADIPPPTHEEQVMLAAREKSKLLDEADEVIRRLDRAVKYDMASEDELASLEAWEKYSVLLMRIKPEDAPGIDWPEKPE